MGYDTSYEGPDSDSSLIFHAEYLSADAVPGHFDAVICRHVIEHVPDIGRFLDELAAIAHACDEPFVFIETPRLEWILQHKSAWDFFYEHCNYFTEPALAGLCARGGFKVLGQYPVFGRQYQLLVLELKNPGRRQAFAPVKDPIRAIQEIHEISLPRLAVLIESERKGRPWAVWGAGAKGVCLANRLPAEHLLRLFDTNPAKQGFHVPGTHIPIVAPSEKKLADIGLVVIANPSYEKEIREDLERFAYKGHVLALSESLL